MRQPSETEYDEPQCANSTANGANTEVASNSTKSNDSESYAKPDLAAVGNLANFNEPCGVCEYHKLHERILAATTCLQNHGDVKQHDSTVASPMQEARDVSLVRLALGGYIEALKQFPEFVKLGKAAHQVMLNERIISQINLFSIFGVNSQGSGWYAADTEGMQRTHSFTEFVEHFQREGVDARSYVDSFRSFVLSIRKRFVHDWNVIVMTLCFIDLCSVRNFPVGLLRFEVARLRQTFITFVREHLARCYAADCESHFHYCIVEFPSALALVVEAQEKLILQTSVNSAVHEHQQAASLPIGASLSNSNSASSLLEPMICHIVAQLNST